MLTKETILEIIEISKTEHIPEKDVAFRYTGKRMCINYYKRKYGIERWPVGKSPQSRMKRKTVLNDNYFGVLTDNTCYYGGFIAADGNVDKNMTRLTITLSNKDKKHIETFLKNLDSDARVFVYNTHKNYESAGIVLSSKKICEDLQHNFNITPQKSLTYQPPSFQKNELKDAFIIGMIDGDGTIGFSKGRNRTRLYISMVGTYETISFIKKRFEEILGHQTSNPHHKSLYCGNTYTIRISDKSARTIFEHFYKIEVPKLERKWKPEIHEYCLNFTRSLPTCRRKGVNIFNLNGVFVKHFDTLEEASAFTNVSVGRISVLCRENNNNHMSGGYMFSRDKTEMLPYVATNPFSRKKLSELL